MGETRYQPWTAIQKIIAALCIVMAIGGMCFLLASNYRSQVKLNRNILAHLYEEAEKSARASSYFFNERKYDLRTLSGGTDLLAFAEVRALNRTNEPVLNSILEEIKNQFDELRQYKTVGKDPIYSRIILADADDVILVDSHDLDFAPEIQRNLKGRIKSKYAELEIISHGSNILACSPVFIRNAYAGQIIAWISRHGFHDQLVRDHSSFSITSLISGSDNFHMPEEMSLGVLKAGLFEIENGHSGKHHRFEFSDPQGNKRDGLAFLVSIPDTPFSIVSMVPAENLPGLKTPPPVVLAIVILTAVVTAGLGFIRRRYRHELVLGERLEKVTQRNQEVQKINRNLTNEIAERRRMEEILRESEMKFSLHFENASDVIYSIDCNFVLLNVSPSVERVLGYRPEELIGRPFQELNLLAPECIDSAVLNSLRLVAGEQVSSVVHEFIAKDGTRVFGEVSSTPVFEDDRVVGFTSIARNVTDRINAEKALRENEQFLRTIMTTIQTGVIIVDPQTRLILDANPFALETLKCELMDVIGRDYQKFMIEEPIGESPLNDFDHALDASHCSLQIANGDFLPIRRTVGNTTFKGRKYLVHSFQVISDIIELLKKQDVNIDLAKKLLKFVNKEAPRSIELSNDRQISFDVISASCYVEGGDHHFVRILPGEKNKGQKTVISLKDQSGHEVSCVLRSIITDLIHHAILTNNWDLELEAVTSALNDEICESRLYRGEDFFTAILAEIDHEKLTFKYLSAGHPPVLLIRGKNIKLLPEPGNPALNLPIGVKEGIAFRSGKVQLQVGDKLIFYTDGLTEMPLNNGRKMITADGLVQIVAGICSEDEGRTASEIIRQILSTIADISRETVVPFDQNTSSDDVTILGLAIEKPAIFNETVINPCDSLDLAERRDRLYDELEQEWLQRGFESPEFRLKTALHEAVVNAWSHGNKGSPAKSITVRWRFGQNFQIEIVDEGEGFDFHRLPDPTIPANLTKSSGRGLYLIRHVADRVHWKSDGSHIVISCNKHRLSEKSTSPISKEISEYCN